MENEELKQEIDNLKNSTNKQIESLKLEISENKPELDIPLSIQNRRAVFNELVFPVTATLQGAAAATADNYDVFFIADRDYVVVSISEIHSVVASDGSAVTLQIQKLTGTEAVASGADLLSTSFNLKATANTVQFGDLVALNDVLTLQRGDRLALDDTGTLTSLTDVNVTVQLRIL